MKNGMRNLPESTRYRNICRFWPSNGSVPHTRTYRTTPKLWMKNTIPYTLKLIHWIV